jgi:5'-3' exoribonuclease 1
MNQQRARRFRSARDAQERIDKALAMGESLPSEEPFDSNCITPGRLYLKIIKLLKFESSFFSLPSFFEKEPSLWQN